jgi:hypothetical protein
LLTDLQQQRLARNESFFREVNERINEIAPVFGAREEHRLEYLCECSDPHCSERISITRAEYEAVRAGPRRFLIAPGHDLPEIEQVVAAGDEHAVVEKEGHAGEVAEHLDPRA